MDDIFGPARFAEVYNIVERLSAILEQVPTNISKFCQSVSNYPDEALRLELASTVREARLRKSVRLEYDLEDILPYRYFESLETWLGDISDDEILSGVKHWTDRAWWHRDTCGLASRAIEKSSIEWGTVEQRLQAVEAQQSREEEEFALSMWSTWRFRPRERVSPLTKNLREQLQSIVRQITDLKNSIDRLADFWGALSSDLGAIPVAVIPASRMIIVSSGRGKDLVEQWSPVPSLFQMARITRRRAADLIQIAPPPIRSTRTGLVRLLV